MLERDGKTMKMVDAVLDSLDKRDDALIEANARIMELERQLFQESQKREQFGEEVECAHMYLDDQRVPREDSVGRLSLVGRIKGLQKATEK